MTTPAEVLRAGFARHTWATVRLIDELAKMPAETLDRWMEGTYGSIAQTLTHLLDADDRYLVRLRSVTPPPYEDRGAQPLDVLRSRALENEGRWNQMLALLEEGKLEARIRDRDDYPDVDHAETLLMLQALHHGDDHRAQICSTLGALELEVPDLDVWTYWAETLSG